MEIEVKSTNMADKIRLENDYNYEASDSDDQYTERQKGLLKKARKGRKKDESDEEEMFKFEEDEESEPEKFEADSDFEDAGEDRDNLPDERAWGKNKATFFSTDFQDNDYRGYTEKEEEIANQEQAEALLIQKRLANELNESDFNLDIFALPEQPEDEEAPVKTTKTDLSDLSRKQKLAMFRAEAPEFEGLVQDFDERLSESKDLLVPAIELFKKVEFPNHPLLDFVMSRNELILNYCTNISFYLMLKAKRVKVKNHPVVKRLIQFRQLISQLDEIFEYVVKPQLEALLESVETESLEENAKLKVLENIKASLEGNGTKEDTSEEGEVERPLFTHKYSSDSEGEGDDEKMEQDDEEGDQKRKITRQIAKNKGLTATKRRELRNPRVKNKNKFRKAVIRRKGAIREVRSKVDLYGGEVSGVKTHLKRSIKLQ